MLLLRISPLNNCFGLYRLRYHTHKLDQLNSSAFGQVKWGNRFITGPPRKSFISSKNALSVFWYNKAPRTLTFWSGLFVTGTAIANLHPNFIFTLGPPIIASGYYGYKRIIEYQYRKLLNFIMPKNYKDLYQNVIEIPKYDETDYKQLLNDINNEYDHFKYHINKIIKQKLNDNITKFGPMFLDSNGQVLINLLEIENFVNLSVEIKLDRENDPDLQQALHQDFHENLPFIKLGIPFYNKDNTKRLGIIECYLLQLPDTQSEITAYKLKLLVFPYKGLPSSSSASRYIIE